MKKLHRILAILGVILIAVAVLAMFISGFIPTLRDLLLNVSLTATATAGAILVALLLIRNREKKAETPEE